MAKKTYILEIVYDDETDEIVDFCECLQGDVKKWLVNDKDIGLFFDKKIRRLLEDISDIGLA